MSEGCRGVGDAGQGTATGEKQHVSGEQEHAWLSKTHPGGPTINPAKRGGSESCPCRAAGCFPENHKGKGWTTITWHQPAGSGSCFCPTAMYPERTASVLVKNKESPAHSRTMTTVPPSPGRAEPELLSHPDSSPASPSPAPPRQPCLPTEPLPGIFLPLPGLPPPASVLDSTKR